MIQESRIKRMSDLEAPMRHLESPINDLQSPPIASGKYVVYWMQASMRIQYNHALAAAIHYANDHKLPLVVCFVLADAYPEANLRHYTFMLEGISEIHDTLHSMGIKFILLRGEPQSALEPLMNHNMAALFMDRGYTRIQRAWRQAVLDKTGQVPI
jgi:deoxyribodipyrimidine photo-lyase